MGIFSDDDVNEAEGLIKGELEKRVELKSRSDAEKEKARLKLEFLKGFEEGWKAWKHLFKSKGTKVDGIWNVPQYISKDLLQNPYEFGLGFGYLVGFLKFDPIGVLGCGHKGADAIIESVKLLKDKPQYYKMLEKRIIRWNNSIKPYVKNLDEQRQKQYLYIIKNV